MQRVSIEALIGKNITDLSHGDDFIDFTCSDGTKYHMYHEQNCCENVYIESISEDINTLKGQTILEAYESECNEPPPDDPESYTWTFYRIRTNLNTYTIRWYGSSNGCYSESVDIYEEL